MKLVLLLTLIFLNSAFAQTLTSTVIDISHDDDITRIYLENGSILKANSTLHNIEVGRTYHFQFKSDRVITLVSSVIHPRYNEVPLHNLYNYPDLFQTYFPTIIPSQQRGNDLFNELEYKHNNSECYNRAHAWTYSWRIKHHIYSSKAWIFFTRKYIRKYDFQWWFHVAPMLHIASDESVIERIADKKFSKRLQTMKEWSDTFMRNKVECPLIDLYSEYANYPETGWCYIMKTNMYYYQPIDLETYERDGKSRTSWNYLEVIQAYKDALEIEL